MDSYSCTTNSIVKFSHTWHIKNFDLSENCNEISGFQSEDFAASEDSSDTFYIQLEPKGNAQNGYLEVKLVECLTNQCVIYTYDLSVSFEENGFCNKTLRPWNSHNESLQIMYNEMYEEPNTISLDDTLKILCKISIVLTDPVCISQNKFALPKRKILNDIEALFNSEEFADVKIVTGDGKKIPAHKNILAARSEVFAAMFKHPLEESQQNCVKICDFKYEVVLEMLRFIYTESAPKLKDMTEELLSAADKYDLELLKAMCLNYLHDNLCVETAAVTLKLADLYQEKKLKSMAIQYIKDYSKNVFETPNWKGLVKTDKILILESFCALKLDDEEHF